MPPKRTLEEKNLISEYGEKRCDALAESLRRTTGSSTGSKHVMFHKKSNKFLAQIRNQHTGRLDYLGRFDTAYAAAVTAALSAEMAMKDAHAAAKIAVDMTDDEAMATADIEGLALTSSYGESGFANVRLQKNTCEDSLRPFRLHNNFIQAARAAIPRSRHIEFDIGPGRCFGSRKHAALVVARCEDFMSGGVATGARSAGTHMTTPTHTAFNGAGNRLGGGGGVSGGGDATALQADGKKRARVEGAAAPGAEDKGAGMTACPHCNMDFSELGPIRTMRRVQKCNGA